MDIGKSITYIGDDEEWPSKIAVGAVISNVPILNFAWLGYLVDIIHNVSHGITNPLPDWSDLGGKWVKGLVLFAAALIYTLPGLLLFGIPLAALIIGNIPSEGSFQENAAAVFTGSAVLLSCCITIYFILLALVFPAINLHFARAGTFGSCFKIKQILKLVFSNLGDYLLALALTWVAALVIGIAIGTAGLVLVLIPCIGWLVLIVLNAVVNVWIGTIYAHLLGQVGSIDPLIEAEI